MMGWRFVSDSRGMRLPVHTWSATELPRPYRMDETDSMFFGYADVGRFGLAHSLLAWARCTVWCEQMNAPMLAPIWLRVRIGPYLRRERDKREYFRLFSGADYVHDPRRALLLLTARKLAAETDLPQAPDPSGSPVVVVFRNGVTDGRPAYFHAIRDHSALLRDRLTRMTRPEFRPALPERPFIAAHVRLGDFSPYVEADSKRGITNMQLPIDWYIRSVRMLSERLPAGTPFVVFSDGSDEELAPLLALPNVVRSASREAVTDMLGVAQAAGLISSGSGFAFWGSFLGQVPRLCYPGQKSVGALVDPRLESEWESGEPDAAVVQAFRQRLSDRAA